jgi:hypothetical protein
MILHFNLKSFVSSTCFLSSDSSLHFCPNNFAVSCTEEDLGIWDLVSWANFKKADIGRFGNSMFGVAACQVEKWS